jgi:uncharacterized protein (DUF302 family)
MGEPTSAAAEDVVTKTASGSVAETVDRLTALLAARALKLFVIVDHSGEARRVGLELRETKLVIFGNPEAGTPVMRAAPLVALDLPLKVLIWDDDGQTKVSYVSPRALADRYRLDDELVQRLMGIESITDALVAG